MARPYAQAISANNYNDAIPEPRDPVLIIAGRHDTVVPVAGLIAFAGRFPNAELHTLEHSGHSSPEEEPEALSKMITGFLTRAPGS